MKLEEVVNRLKDENLYTMEMGFWVLVLYAEYQEEHMTEDEMLQALGLKQLVNVCLWVDKLI